MTETTTDWRAAAGVAWREHKRADDDARGPELREALQRLSKRLELLGVPWSKGAPVDDAGTIRVLLQEGRAVPVQHPDRTEPLQREVWACTRGRELWLEAGEDYGTTPAISGSPDTRLMYAGELATLADVGRALAGDDLRPIEDTEPPSVADQLLIVLRALIDDALADAMEGRL